MAKRGYKLQEFMAHSGNVNCLSFGKKNCRLFITGGDDQKVNLWSVGKPTSVVSLCGHTSPVESAAFDSAEVLVVAGSSSGAIKLWDLEETKMVRTLTGHRSYCTAVEFHPFGEFFASGSMDTNLKIWDIRKKGCIHTYKGHTRGISTIRFTPDGRWVVSGGFDNVVKIWDLTAGKMLHDFKFHEGHIRSIEFHPLEFLLATGSADKTVKFWDLETFEMIGSARRESSGVRAIAFHPDGRNLFCGLDDSLKVYSWEPVICRDSVDMGWSTLGDLCIHDGKLLGGAYYENSVAVWVADISLIEQSENEQYSHSEQKSESEGSRLEKAKDESPVVKPNVPFDNQDSDSKEIKTIYVDRVNSVTPKAIDPINAPEVVLSSFNSKAVEPVNAPKVVQNSVTPKAVEPVTASKVVQNSVTPKAVELVNAPKVVQNSVTLKAVEPVNVPKVLNSVTSKAVEPVNAPKVSRLSESKEVGTATQKRVSAKANPLKGRSVIIPSIVPRDSFDGKDFSGSIRESIGSAKASIGVPPRQSTLRRLSTGRFGMERMSVSLDAGTAEKIESPLGIKRDTNLFDKVRADENAKESSDRKLPIINAPEIAKESVEGKQSSTEAAENFDKTSLATESSDRTSNSSGGANPVKVINGVTVVHGRTRSLVEKFEKKEKFNAEEILTPDKGPGATVEPQEAQLSEKFSGGSSAPAEPPETPTGEEFDKGYGATAEPLETYPMQKHHKGYGEITEPSETYPIRKPDMGRGVSTESLETYTVRNPDSVSSVTAEPFESSPIRKPDKGFGGTTEPLETLRKQRRGSAVRVEPLEIPPIRKPKRGFGTAPVPQETSLIQKVDRRSRTGANRRCVTPDPYEAPPMQKPDRSHLSAEPPESPQLEKFERRSGVNAEPLEMPVLQNYDQKTTAREEPIMDDTCIENLMQNHDVLLSTFRSRLTKLQVVRHFWERNDMKGAINAVNKLPDHSVQADVVGILIERLDKITLDLFSCMLPVLLGLLDSKAERYVTISLEMLLKLVAVFGPTIHSTALARPGVGVDLHAEERRECCKRCFAYLEDIRRKLPELVKRGGSITRFAQQLNLVLQQT